MRILLACAVEVQWKDASPSEDVSQLYPSLTCSCCVTVSKIWVFYCYFVCGCGVRDNSHLCLLNRNRTCQSIRMLAGGVVTL